MGEFIGGSSAVVEPENNAESAGQEQYLKDKAEWDDLCARQGKCADEGMPNPKGLPVWTEQDAIRYRKLEPIFGKRVARELATDRDYRMGLGAPAPIDAKWSSTDIDNAIRRQRSEDMEGE